MKIDKQLNLVIPITSGDGKTIYVHSMPIGREIYERYFLSLSKTFAAIWGEGLTAVSGPKVSALMLKKMAIQIDDWEGDDGVANGLLKEIHRLTNIIVSTDKGWQSIPLETAMNQKLIDPDDYYEAEGQIVFFICVSAIHRKGLVAPTLTSMSALWNVQISSLNCTEYAASLPTSTVTESIGETVPLSVIPS